jgi:GNAT superfamily N-acetyltransferase
MIRLATPDDAAAIAAVHVRCWQTAYRGYFPDDFLDGLNLAERTERWGVWLADAAEPTAVDDAPGGIAGFVRIGPSRDPGASGATGELLAIYVEPSRWRRGVGTELMSWATAAAPARGWTAMTLWTIEGNARARSFYERCRWFPDGATKREPFAGHLVTQVRYAWPALELELHS